jgi:small subunit ribosomal protein S17
MQKIRKGDKVVDVVSIEECAPISKDKTWTVVSAQAN